MCYVLHLFSGTNEIVLSLQVTLLLQEFFQEKVKSINLMMEIIQYIALLYYCFSVY